MRKILSFVALFALILLSGCSNLGTPKHLEDPEFEGWILRSCASSSLQESIKDNFLNKVRSHQIKVKGFETIGTFEDAVLDYFGLEWDRFGGFEYSFDYKHKQPKLVPIKLEEYLAGFKDEDFETGKWYSDEKNRARSLCKTNPTKASTLLKALRESYFREYDLIAKKDFSVLNWTLDESSQGDKYTGYLIEYEIGEGYYVLVSLIEYDKSNRYTAKILYSGNSLQEMQSYYE